MKARTKTQESFLFAFNMFARAVGILNPINTSGDPMWAAFLEVLKIRDRLTHPKDSVDLSISHEEVALIGQVLMWVADKTSEAATEAASKFGVDKLSSLT